MKIATRILHCQDDVTKLTAIYDLLQRSTKKFSFDDYDKFFSEVALEAFQFEAESGSIAALDWAIALVETLDDYVKDQFKRYVILVDIGFTMYNYIRDAKNRYLMPDEEQCRFLKLFHRYKKLLGKGTFLANFSVYDQWHLGYLADTIYVSFIASSTTLKHSKNHRSYAKEKLNKALKYCLDSNTNYPSILAGLLLYHSGKLDYLNEDFESAWAAYIDAMENLKYLAENEGSTASYYYDVFYGEY